MVPTSPVEALGAHSGRSKDLLVGLTRQRHTRSADAHAAADSRYAMGFGTQWRDLLDDADDAFTAVGYQRHRLMPGGYHVPVVNKCLIYVWRVPGTTDAVSAFAASPTRRSGFAAPPPDDMLFEPGAFSADSVAVDALGSGSVPAPASPDETRLVEAIESANGVMPVILVMVESSPRVLQSIQWAIAQLDDEGKVELIGAEAIWTPEFAEGDEAFATESFDSGSVSLPALKPHEQFGPFGDA